MNVDAAIQSDLHQNRARRRRLYTKPLSGEEFKILTEVADNPFAFSKFIWVIHSQMGKIKFDLFPFQRAVLREFITKRFNIVLKFRQAGLTELIAMFCLWYAMFHSNKTIQIISIKDIVAKKVLRRIKFMYRNLLPFLQVPIVNGRAGDLGTSSEIEFANGSLISSIPTTEEAGRSESLSILVIDEAAIIRWADQIWAAAFPTLSNGGRAILNSTPYGMGNFFHKRWTEAFAGGLFNPIRLRWPMHPWRNQEWYDDMKAALGPRRTAQEIDGDFLSSGNNVFDLMDIRAIEESLDDYMPLDVKHLDLFKPIHKGIRNLGNNLKVFNLPDPHKRYAIGADVSTGRARDYSAFTILDNTGEEAVAFKKKLPINEYSNLLSKMGYIYNRALIGVESNDIGLGVAVKLQENNYPNLHYSEKLLKEKGVSKPKVEKIPGWYTTSKNRPVIIAELEEDVRLNHLLIKDPDFVQEAYTFIYDERNKPVALGKTSGNTQDPNEQEALLSDEVYTDDSIMSKAIGNHLRKLKQRGPVILPL